MEEDAKIAAQKSGRLSFYVVNAIADGCTFKPNVKAFQIKRKDVFIGCENGSQSSFSSVVSSIEAPVSCFR